jgi:hypothetical protein
MQRSRTKAHRSPTGSKIPALCIPLGLLLCLLGALCPVATVDAQSGFTFPLTETFKGSTAPGWQLGGSAVLTNEKNGTDGWLRLTPNSTYQAGYAYYNTPIATGRGLVVTFDYGAWGGNWRRRSHFFSVRWYATTAFNVGASGGSLGYAQKTGVKGLSNGYLGLGLDEFGNYSNPNEGRSGGPGATPHAVAIRGPGNGTTGYAYLAGTTRLDRAPWNLPRLDCPNNGVNCLSSTVTRLRPTAYLLRQVRITVTPIGAAYQVAVAMRFNYSSTTWTPLLGPFTMPTSAPSTLKMGFAASTGGNYNYHEIPQPGRHAAGAGPDGVEVCASTPAPAAAA